MLFRLEHVMTFIYTAFNKNMLILHQHYYVFHSEHFSVILSILEQYSRWRVFNNQSNFDWLLYKQRCKLPVHKKTNPMLAYPVA